MKINKQKRIGEIIIFAEGEEPEFQIIENIFHKYLGYTIIKSKRSNKDVIELKGHDKYSKVILLNTPTSNIKNLKNGNQFYDYIFKDYVLPLNIDTINNPVYVIFDRDAPNNRESIVEKMLTRLNNSQNDTDEQNGLLLLSYPSSEAFLISLSETNSYARKMKLGKHLKEIIRNGNYTQTINDETISNATNEFINFLIDYNLLDKPKDLVNKLDTIGSEIFKIETDLFGKESLFYCVSQIVEILIDLQIIEL